MKAVILAGGFGIRHMEETQTIPNSLVPIGGKPFVFGVGWCLVKE